MATLIATADGNLTGATTFAAAEVGALALNLVRNTTTTVAAAASVTSATFTVTTAKVIDAVLLWVKQSAAGSTGTFKVDLQKSAVSQGSVTVNKTDLPDTTNVNPVPVLFKLGATATGDGAATWTIVITTTGTNTVTYNINAAGATNFTRALRTTTTATPAAADDLYIVGELTGAGTKNTRTVTMDSTVATAYGNGTLNTTANAGGGIHISNWGTLTYGTTASTAYIMRVNGDVIVYQFGMLNIISPQTSTTQVLEFQPVSADGDFGLRCLDNAVVTITGQPRTAGKNVVKCKLTSNLAAAGTTLNVDTDTGWLSGDQVCIASTTRTAAECELATLSGNAGASSFTTGAVTNAHSGAAPTQAEVGNITRNVKIRSTSTTLMAYVYCTALATVTASWAEFYYVGANIANKRGIEVDGGAVCNPKSFTYCSVHDLDSNGFYCNTNTTSLNVTFSNNIIWNTLAQFTVILTNVVTNADWILDNNLLMKVASFGFGLSDVSGVFTNNTVVGAASNGGISYNAGPLTIGTFNNNTVHSCTGNGLLLGTSANLIGAISNFKAWRNTVTGVSISAIGNSDLVFNNLTLFGNSPASQGNFNHICSDVTINGGLIAGDTSSSSSHGIINNSAGITRYNVSNVDMSGAGSIYAPHTTLDVATGTAITTAQYLGQFNNCKFGAPNLLLKSTWQKASYIGFEKYNQTAGDHRTEMTFGQLRTDSAVYNTASPSMRMTPNNASNKLESASLGKGIQVAVNSGDTVTAKVWLRKDSTYFGSQPRLIVRANVAIGVSSDTVLATCSDLTSVVPATFLGGRLSGMALSNGNLTAARTDANIDLAALNNLAAYSTGKYYFEWAWTSAYTNNSFVKAGVMLTTALNADPSVNTNATLVWAGSPTSPIYSNNANTGKTLGQVFINSNISAAIDLTNRLAWFRLSGGNWNGDPTANPATGVGGVAIAAGGLWVPFCTGYNSFDQTVAATFNFGATTFAFTAPSGFGNWTMPAYAGTATWVQLSGTTIAATDDGVMEFIVDCDGTAGFVSVDDWVFS